MLANLLRQVREDGIVTVLEESAGRRGAVYALGSLVNLSEGRQVF